MKSPNTHHHRSEASIGARSSREDVKKNNSPAKRIGAGIVGLAVIAGTGLLAKGTYEDIREANVDFTVDDSTLAATRLLREKGVSIDEIEEKVGVEIYVAGKDGTTLYGIGQEYLRDNPEDLEELRPGDVVDEALIPQNGYSTVISGGEEFVLRSFNDKE